MSIVTLLITIWVAYVLSVTADAFPNILWSWIHLPVWLLWLPIVVTLAWCMDEEG